MSKRHYQVTPNKYLSVEEQAQLQLVLAADESRDATMIRLAIATGARAQEVLNITPADLYHHEQSVLIRGLKGSNDRVLPLKPKLFAAITALAADGKPFPIRYSRLHQIWDYYKPFDKPFKSLRHTFAIELYKRCRDIRLVQNALGHRDIANTMVYMQLVHSIEDFRKHLL
jgi:integrase/recombinase XerC